MFSGTWCPKGEPLRFTGVTPRTGSLMVGCAVDKMLSDWNLWNEAIAVGDVEIEVARDVQNDCSSGGRQMNIKYPFGGLTFNIHVLKHLKRRGWILTFGSNCTWKIPESREGR